MRLKENLLQKFAATLKKFSAQGGQKVEYGISKNMVYFHKIQPKDRTRAWYNFVDKTFHLQVVCTKEFHTPANFFLNAAT